MTMNRDEQEAKTNRNNSSSAAVSSSDEELEETRQRIEAWMGIGSTSNSSSSSSSKKVPTIPNKSTTTKPKSAATPVATAAAAAKLLSPSNSTSSVISETTVISEKQQRRESRIKGILKSPKYSSSRLIVAHDSSDKEDENDQAKTAAAAAATTNESIAASTDDSTPLIVKDRVVERMHPVAQPLPHRKSETTTTTTTIDSTYAPEGSLSSLSLSALAIEGHTPRLSSRSRVSFNDRTNQIGYEEDDDGASIVLSSMEDLWDLAQQANPSPQNSRSFGRSMARIETDLEFSCMTAEEYEESISNLPQDEGDRRQLLEYDRQWQHQVFSGRRNVFAGVEDDSDDDDDDANENGDGPANHHNDTEPSLLLTNPSDNDDDDHALLDVLQPQDDDDEEDDAVRQPSEARAFLLLWTAISQWVTPQSVALLDEWNRQDRGANNNASSNAEPHTTSNGSVLGTVADRGDIEASRCAGLQAMLKMNLPRAMDELQQPPELRRFLDIHLAELLSTFDYEFPISVKMEMNMWRAMTCVFVDTVLTFASKEQQAKYATTTMTSKKNDSNKNTGSDSRRIPASAQAVGLKEEEYNYLVQSAIATLKSPQPELI